MVASRAAPGGVVQIRLFGQIERVDDDHSRLHAVFFTISLRLRTSSRFLRA